MSKTVKLLLNVGPYRLHDGQIQIQKVDGDWMKSAHDEATADEISHYEAIDPDMADLLKQKYGVTA